MLFSVAFRKDLEKVLDFANQIVILSDMNTHLHFKKFLVGIFVVTILLALVWLLPTVLATPAKTRILILPFTLLEQGGSSSELAGNLHRIFQDIFNFVHLFRRKRFKVQCRTIFFNLFDRFKTGNGNRHFAACP